jgi:hypothetical protein
MTTQAAGLGPGFFLIFGTLCLLFIGTAFLAFRATREIPRFGRLLQGTSAAALLIAGLFGALCGLELVFRIIYPGGMFEFQPHQASRADARVEQLPDGQAFWEYIDTYLFNSDGYRDDITACSPDSVRIGILGDSITYGVKVEYAETFVDKLRPAFEARCGPVCLYNVATPGYSILQERISYERKLSAHQPQLVFLGLFSNDLAQFTVIGSNAYDVRMKEHEGIPIFTLLPLPDDVNAFFISNSVFYQFVTMRSLATFDKATGKPATQRELAMKELERIRVLCEEQKAVLVVALFPDLDRPLSDPEPESSSFLYDKVRTWADHTRTPIIDLRTSMADLDVEKIRLDECCHYNEYGHRVVARILEEQLTELKIFNRIDCNR